MQKEQKIRSVVTHYRDFHADDVFAIAIIKILFPKINITRAEFNDKKTIEKADIRVDIGGKYNPETLDFDNHQSEGAGFRDNSIPYASCGLVWHHFGMEIVKDLTIFEEIDKKIIQTIDAVDNGVEISEVKIIRPYTISDYIFSLNPQWPDENLKNFDKKFKYAVEFAVHVLNTEIDKIRRRLDSEIKLKEYIIKNDNKNYLIIEEDLPWKDYVISNTSYKFVIKHDSITKRWNINAVPLIVDSFDTRDSFPKNWSGLRGEELERVSGVNGAIFCHRGLFFAVAKTKENAIELVERALNIR
jgi:uncharacterized UPF0160 family protein